MSGMINREFVAQMVIILGVVAGGWIFSVRPNALHLAEAQRKITEATDEQSSLGEQTIQELSSKLEEFRMRADDFMQRNALAEDSSRLYGMIMDTAGEYSVKVTNLQPAASRTNQGDHLSIAQLDVAVEGTFESVAGFMQAVTNLPTFIRPKSLQFAPVNAENSKLVSARLGADVISFKKVEGLEPFGDTGNVQP